MLSRYAGKCAVCQKAINIGDDIGKDRNLQKWVHLTCVDQPPVAAAPAVRKPRRAAQTDIEVWAAQGVVTLASLDHDRASVVNGVGFNKMDGDAGHDFAEKISRNENLTDGQWAYVVKIATRYQRQIGPKPVVEPVTVPVDDDYEGRCDGIASLRTTDWDFGRE